MRIHERLQSAYHFYEAAIDALPRCCGACVVGRSVALEVSTQAEAEHHMYGSGDLIPVDCTTVQTEVLQRLQPRCKAVAALCIPGQGLIRD